MESNKEANKKHVRTVAFGITGVALLYVAVIHAAIVAWLPAPTHNPLPTVIGSRDVVAEDSAGKPSGRVAAVDEHSQDTPYSVKQSKPSNLALAAPASKLAKLAVNPPKAAYRDKTAKIAVIDNQTYPLRTYKPSWIPNDPSSNQWWVTNTHLDSTWDIPQGNRQTTLAIIDTGFGLKHEEFANRLYINAGESGSTASEAASQLNCTARGLPLNQSCNLIDEDANGTVDDESGATTDQNPSRLNCTAQGKPLDKSCNRIDDDGNGYVDDVSGWDFANNDNSSQAGEINPSGSGTTHGTRTMGVAAATGNNGKGIAGVDWKTKILPMQALDDDSYGDTLSVGRSIYYAADQHADVISISLGSNLPDYFLRQAMQYAIARGSVIVVSAGNDGCDCITYPAAYPEAVAVGALDTNNQPASFSSYGANLDILAPGTGIRTTNWTAGNGTSSYVNNVAGTSFAAPMVAGLMSRLLSVQPNIAPLQLIATLTENTNRLTLPSTISRTNSLGFGTLDAVKSMQRAVTWVNETLRYELSVSRGAGLTPNSPTEPLGNYSAVRCAEGVVGTTPIYELTGYGERYFTISQVEVWLAENTGYQSSLFTYACLQLPQDPTNTVRNINLTQEFRDSTPKSQ